MKVTFRPDAFDKDPAGTTSVPYEFDTKGCLYQPLPTPGNPNGFSPRPVTYEPCNYDRTKMCPKAPPICDGGTLIRSEVKGPDSTNNTGRFVDYSDYSTFEIVSNVTVSQIFKFTWCPAQDKFQVTVFKQGNRRTGCPYQFYQQTDNVVALQSEKARLQAEINRLKAEKTGTIKVVFV